MHALLCARGPSTRGHNAVRDELFRATSTVDSASELEPTGLVTSHPGLRPADLLTGASGLSARLVALDVGVCCPAASGAGADCVESMRHRKVVRMAPYQAELNAAGIDYRPVIFSCFGRPHADAQRVLQTLARRQSRRRGTEAHIEERRLGARIGVEIWRRAARMVRQCLSSEVDDEPDSEQPALVPAVMWRVGHPWTVEQEPLSAPAGMDCN